MQSIGLLGSIGAAVLLLTACGGGGSSPSDPTPSAPTPAPDASTPAPAPGASSPTPSGTGGSADCYPTFVKGRVITREQAEGSRALQMNILLRVVTTQVEDSLNGQTVYRDKVTNAYTDNTFRWMQDFFWSRTNTHHVAYNPEGLNTFYNPPAMYPLNMEIGKEYQIRYAPNTQHWNLEKLTYMGREKITVPAGTFETCRFVSKNTNSVEMGEKVVTTWRIAGGELAGQPAKQEMLQFGIGTDTDPIVVKFTVTKAP